MTTIDKLNHFVLRAAFDFEGADGIAQMQATEYIDALVVGLRSQRSEREAKHAELRRRMQALEAEASKHVTDKRS